MQTNPSYQQPYHRQVARNHGANTVLMSGWLSIESVETIALRDRTALAVRACLFEQQPDQELIKQSGNGDARNYYPILLTGIAADILVSWAQTHSDPPRVSVQGRLRRDLDGGLIVRAKYLDIQNIETGALDPSQGLPA